MELLFFWLIMAGVVAFVANSKGKSGGLWFFYGLVIWPIALIHAIVTSKEPEAVERQQLNQGNIRCPNCADWVYKQAKTCPHCQHRLTGKSQVQPASLSKTVRESLIIEDAEDFWQGDRDLDSAKYKLYLSEKYNIKKNDLFEKYVCLDEMFDTLDEALAHAHEADRESAETQRNAATTVVQSGAIGPSQQLTYQEFASGETVLTHPSGASYRFKSMAEVKAFIAKFSTEDKIRVKLLQSARIGRIPES